MKVKDKMTPNPITITAGESIHKAWTLMQKHNITRLPVLDQHKIVGILTISDIGARPDLDFHDLPEVRGETALAEDHILNQVKVRDVMSSERALITIPAGEFIEEAAKLLNNINTPGLLVVNDENQLVGIITQTDIFNALLDLLAINRSGTRISLRINSNPETLIKILQIVNKYHLLVENMVSMEIKDESHLLIMRLNTLESQPIVNDLTSAGFQVESIIVKQ